MTTRRPWDLEEDDAPEVPTTSPPGIYDLPHQPTLAIVLMDSGKEDWGEIRVIIDYFPTGFKEGDLIGYWNRVKFSGLISGQLTTPLDALRDKGIQVRAKLSKDRKARKEGKPPPGDEKGEVSVEFNDLRAKLMGSR